MNLEKGAWVDPCWGALNDLILEEGERRVKARQKWVRRFGKKKVGDGKGGRVSWSQRPRLRRSDRLMKKNRVSHPDEEDPGAICTLLGAMKLKNVWGGEEGYSVSLEQEEGKSGGKGQAKRARKRRVRIS